MNGVQTENRHEGAGAKPVPTALSGKVLVCIVAGYSQKRTIYRRIKELGVRLVILDVPDSWGRDLPAEGLIEKFYAVELSDEASSFQNCLLAIQRTEKEVGRVDGVLSFWEWSEPLVSRLTAHLGLAGNPLSAVENARNKKRTLEVMQSVGLPTPKSIVLKSQLDLEKAAAEVGFPAVIKPISGAGSMGVIKVENPDDLSRAYVKVQKEISGFGVASDGSIHYEANDAGKSEAGNPEAGGLIAETFMLEQYLDGEEVDVDLVLSDGQTIYSAITDNWPTVEPYFNETGSNCPSLLPRDKQEQLRSLAVESALALGFRWGVLHIELKFTSHGPQMIEINARMGGGPVSQINETVWGIDLIEQQCLASAGIKSQPSLPDVPLKMIAEYSVNAKTTGILEHTGFLKEWEQHPDIIYARPLAAAGDKVLSKSDGIPTWVYEMMASKRSVEESISLLRDIERAVEPNLPIKAR